MYETPEVTPEPKTSPQERAKRFISEPEDLIFVSLEDVDPLAETQNKTK
jgi:hypothetical protein